MKIFITGADGFIGRHLSHKLLKLGHEVWGDMKYFSHSYDLIIHLAAVTHIRNEFDPKLIESNIILSNEVFKRPERIIYASSCSAAYFTNPYAMSKMWCEHLGRKHSNALGLRFFNVYGHGNNKGIVRLLMSMRETQGLVVRGPDTIRDYIHVEDVVNYIIKVLRRERYEKRSPNYPNGMPTGFPRKDVFVGYNVGVHDVGTGVGTSTMDLINLYQKLSGKSFNISAIDAGDNEPAAMVSSNVVPHCSLEEGLLKMINQ